MIGLFAVNVLTMTLTGTLVFLSVSALKRFWGGRLAQGWNYALSLLPLLFFLFPSAPLLHAALGHIPAAGAVLEQLGEIPPPLQEWMPGSPGAASRGLGPGLSPLPAALPRLWLAGCMLGLFREAHAYVRFRRFLLRNSSRVTDPAMLDLFTGMCRETGVRGKAVLMESHCVGAPILSGVFRPALILPKTSAISLEETELVFRHELIHCRRGDLAVKLAAAAACAIHWFNPVCRLMASGLEECQELACDERVVLPITREERLRYGNLILRSALNTAPRNKRKYGLFAALHGGKSGKTQIKRRLSAIMNIEKKKSRTATAVILACLLAGIGASAGFLLYGEGPASKPAGQGSPALPPSQMSLQTDRLPGTLPDADTAAPGPASLPGPISDTAIAEPPNFANPTGSGYIACGVDTYPGHTGIDIAAPADTPVYAAADGKVTSVERTYYGYGNYIVIDHGGQYQTLYAHCSELYVEEDDEVSQGQHIADLGRTGNATGFNLHFEIRHKGDIEDPLDYLSY